MQMNDMTPSITTSLHPDALYDDLYEQAEVDISSYMPLGGTFTTEADDQGVTLASENACIRIDAWAEGIVRLRVNPTHSSPVSSPTEEFGLLEPRPEIPSFSTREEGTLFILETSLLSLRIDTVTGGVELLRSASGTDNLFTESMLKSVPGTGLRFDNSDADTPAFYAEFEHADEAFHGFGGRIAPPNRTGQTVDIFSVKTGKRSGDYGGFPLPYFISSKGYGFFLNNPWPHVYFDMAKSATDRWSVHSPGGPCDIFFMAGPTQSDVVKRFTSIVGRPSSPARWLMGFWCCSLGFASGEQAIKDAKQLRRENYPCDVFVFDGPWRSGLNFINSYATGHDYPSCDFDWHPDFGDGPGMVRELDALGIKTGLHVNSRSFSPKATESGLAAGLLRQHGEEVVPRVGDATAEAHYISQLEPRVKEKVAIWWTDHADRVSGDVVPGIPSRNLFGPLWNRVIARMMPHSDDSCPMSLSRGGGIGSQRYALPWPGDTRCGVDALIDDLWFVINAGLSGFPFSSADLGGFAVRGEPGEPGYETLAERDAEMFDDENIARRVCQALLYIPLPRIHNNWETTPKFPWNCSEEIQPLYRKAIEERYALTPYWYHYALNAADTGEPILRPLSYHHPEDVAALNCDDQFYLGEDLMMAPAYREGEEQRSVYLPEGEWINYWTGEQHVGPVTLEVSTPLMSLEGVAVFVRKGAIIPRQPVTPSLGNKLPESLELTVYPSASDSQRAFNEGNGVLTELLCRHEEDGLRVTVSNGSPLRRPYTIRLHGDELYTIPEVDASEAAHCSQAAVELTLLPGEQVSILWKKELSELVD
ncbi:glycoside hydrolase family 31 protein [Kiritimatiellota bacterium B12222]|nr:glycoside hydrolase family 31 protein [Kiritimatiellota bacterium B12222]